MTKTIDKREEKISKKKDQCPCCVANGYSYSKPFLAEERKHIMDHGWIPEEAEGAKLPFKGTSWVAACSHVTGKKVKHYQTWAEYECKCECDC